MSVRTWDIFSKVEAENYAKDGMFSIKNITPIKVDTIHNILLVYNNGIFPDFIGC